MAVTRYSGIIHQKNERGEYDELLPMNTIDEVYYDIDNAVKLREILNQLIDYRQVDSIDNMYGLTANDVNVGSIIKVANGYTYKVVDITNLSNADGYEKVTELGAAGTSITLTTYNNTDLN